MIPLTSDPVVGTTVLAVTGSGGVVLWRRGVRGWRLAASLPILLSGIALTLMLAAHYVEVVGSLLAGALFGVTMARYLRRRARGARLPPLG